MLRGTAFAPIAAMIATLLGTAAIAGNADAGERASSRAPRAHAGQARDRRAHAGQAREGTAHSAHRRERRAHATKAMRVHDGGHLRFKSDAATAIVDEGHLSGTLPGTGRVTFDYNGSPKVSAHFTIQAQGGAVYGKAKCRMHNPASPAPSFRGALTITGGSGRFAHARGKGELYGVYYRHGYALSVQAIGSLTY